MLNQDKYTTAEERVRKFREFLDTRCRGSDDCEKCEVHALCRKLGYYGRAMGWLALEAEEEKLESCPFCGSRMGEGQSSDGKRVLICDNRNCGYITPKGNTRAEAVAAHNRVARAVRAAESEKGEVK